MMGEIMVISSYGATQFPRLTMSSIDVLLFSDCNLIESSQHFSCTGCLISDFEREAEHTDVLLWSADSSIANSCVLLGLQWSSLIWLADVAGFVVLTCTAKVRMVSYSSAQLLYLSLSHRKLTVVIMIPHQPAWSSICTCGMLFWKITNGLVSNYHSKSCFLSVIYTFVSFTRDHGNICPLGCVSITIPIFMAEFLIRDWGYPSYPCRHTVTESLSGLTDYGPE